MDTFLAGKIRRILQYVHMQGAQSLDSEAYFLRTMQRLKAEAQPRPLPG